MECFVGLERRDERMWEPMVPEPWCGVSEARGEGGDCVRRR
jgi:hypothetical protein